MVKTVIACKRYIETAGMRLSNSEIIYTDLLNADTDSDGLKDGEEIIPQFKFAKNILLKIKFLLAISNKYVIMKI